MIQKGFNEKDKFYIAAWQSLSMRGSLYASKLLEYFPSAQDAWEAPQEEILSAGIIPDHTVQRLVAARMARPDYPEQLMEECQQKHISLVSIAEAEYPQLLAKIYNPPQVLFYRGRIDGNAKRIAVVGARKVTSYGKSMAGMLGKELAAESIHVVSGGALGVDAEAHRGALAAGVTEVILGCGIDIPYPRENQCLYREVEQRGAVISEYPPGTKPYATLFPLRNRIISGMSRGVVVVEAAERSGSLITAEYAINENRDVFAVPGSVFAATSKGCNKLIQQGAKLIISSADVLADYDDWRQSEKVDLNQEENIMDHESQQVCKLLTSDVPLTIDEIIYKLECSIKPNKLSYLLLRLELKGKVRKYAGGYIAIP